MERSHYEQDNCDLAILQRLFATALVEAKSCTSLGALEQMQRVVNRQDRNRVIEAHIVEWRESSAAEIATYLPRFVEFGAAHAYLLPSVPMVWAEDMMWRQLRSVCGIQRFGADYDFTRVSHSVRCWLAMATQGEHGYLMANLPGGTPWKAPRWLATGLSGTEQLIRAIEERMSTCFYGVIEKELERLQQRYALANEQRRPAPGTPSSRPARAAREITLGSVSLISQPRLAVGAL